MFTFTPLLGAKSEVTASSSLLEFENGIKVLVDVGWDSSFDRAMLTEIAQHASTLSIILLTHATIEHLGAYAHCCKYVPGFSAVPTYATTPVVNLGRTLTADLFKSSPPGLNLMPREGSADSISSDITLPLPPQEDIASFFGRIHPLNYSQPHQPNASPFSPPLNGLTITAYGAGHSLGGTIWHIQQGMESVIFATDWNQTRENLFDGARLLEAGGQEVIEPLQRPTVLLCSSRGVERASILSTKKRDESLVSLIRETIAQGGKVLIPTDSSSRLLELAFVLNLAWQDNMDGPHAATFKDAKIYMATRSSKATIRNLQSMLEWVEPGVAQAGEAAMTAGTTGMHPLHWGHVRQIERKTQMERALNRKRPSVILASDLTMDWGFSRQALQALASDARNLIIMTEKSVASGTVGSGLGRQLWNFYHSQQGAISPQSNVKVVGTDGRVFPVSEATLSDLSEEDTALYQQYLLRQNQMQSTMPGNGSAEDPTSGGVGDEQADDSSSSESEDEDTEQQGKALNFSAQMTQSKRKVGLSAAELGVNILLKSKDVYDYDVRDKRGREKMYPYVTRRSRTDDFGELIKPEEYLRAEERQQDDNASRKNAEKSSSNLTAGQKRKWDEIGGSKGKTKSNTTSPKKLAAEGTAQDRGPDYYDEVIARATGAAAGNGASSSAKSETAAHVVDDSDTDEQEGDESDYEPEDEGAKRVTFRTMDLPLHLRVAHVDYSGLAALTDIVNIVSLIRPRKMIISAGTVSETELLREKCRAIPELSSAETLTPAVGETVEASMDIDAWTLKLSPDLVRRLEWQTTDIRGGEMRIASVSGLLTPAENRAMANTGDDTGPDEGESKTKKAKLSVEPGPARSLGREDEKKESLPLLTLPPLVASTSSTAAKAVQPVRVGELRILDLRAHLTALGHDVAVRGQGTLVVDGSVVVRKIPATGRVEVECVNAGFRRARGRTVRLLPGATGVQARQVLDTRGVFFGVREEVERALAIVR